MPETGSPSPADRRFEQALPAAPESVPRLRHGVTRFATLAGASDRVRRKVALAVSEACTNAVVHAYRGPRSRGRGGEVQVCAEQRDRCLEVTVSDTGCGMAPRADSPGLGLGAPLMAVLADHMEITENAAGTGTTVRLAFALT
ncbi:MAG TPA: ATP-binding protein [Capillimicrobium sp.]